MKKNNIIKYLLGALLLVGIFLITKDVWVAAPPSGPFLSDYTAYPPFTVGSSSTPNVMILLSNDHTNYYKGYNDTLDIDDDGSVDTTYTDTIEYYGYFDPDKCYTYSSSVFVPSTTVTPSSHYCTGSRWSGNFLNWATMTHADFVRKALTGGKRVMDSATKTTLLRGNVYDLSHSWNKVYSGADINQLTPYSGAYTFRNRGTSLYVRSGSYPDATCDGTITTDWACGDTGGSCITTSCSTSFTVEVEVCNNTVGLENNCKTYQDVGVTTYKPAGLLIRHADQLRFGLMTYSVGSYNEEGGILRRNIQNIVNEINPNGTVNSGIADGILRYINDFTYKGWDPVAEMFYEAVRYYKFLAPTTTYRCGGGAPYTDDNYPIYCNQSASRMWTDPIQEYCQFNYIIVVNDEYPSKDHDRLPSAAYGAGVTPNDSGINTYNWTNSVGSLENINGNSRSVGATTCTVSGTDCTNAIACSSQLINNLGTAVGICPSEPTAEGTFNIAGLAYYAHTQDLRTGNCGGAACKNSQTIKTYAIAYRASPGGYLIPGDMNGDGDFNDAGDYRSFNQLFLASKYGGFDDDDGNGQIDLVSDWDEKNNSTGVLTPDGIPDNYFVAEKGADFENAFSSIITDILNRASSGTAASVLATTGEGEGAVYQAYFVPKKTVNNIDVTWIGYLHGVFVDKYGNMREDTLPADATLDYAYDYIIQMSYNATSTATEVNKYDDADGDGVAEASELVPGSPFTLGDISPIWEAGGFLWNTNVNNRIIKTSIQDTCTSATPCATINFTTANKATLRPYLRAANNNEAEAIIRYIRGEDTPMTIGGTAFTYRNRTLDINGVSKVWKLGDIVYSTPTAVAAPAENYEKIYKDSTYATFKQTWSNRRQVVYAGANDGMLHAFNAGFFDYNNKRYCDAYSSGTTCSLTHNDLGKELFAFIPQSLLPHLKWLTDINYSHVYYVDLKPKVIDARIFTADATHVNGWGTVLIGGMRFGGRNITYSDTAFTPNSKTFYSAYFALDITNPDATDGSYGKLLWTYTDTTGDLNMTTSYPAVLREGDSSTAGTWFVIFGSGPTSYAGTSTMSGKIYVLNLATGALARKFATPTSILMNQALMADPITVDVGLDYKVDVIYIGDTYLSGTNWKGKMLRVTTASSDNPNTWTLSTLVDPSSGNKPISSAPSASLDTKGNLWVFFGTGKFWSVADKTNVDIQSFYGVKDSCQPWINAACTTTMTNFLDMSSATVAVGGSTVTGVTGVTDWTTLLNAISLSDGWVINFPSVPGHTAIQGERSLNKPLVLGGLVVFATYVPGGVCSAGGDSYVFAPFYETGTAYKNYVFTEELLTTPATVGREKYLGYGLPSSIGATITSDGKLKGFAQQSTGAIIQIEQLTPFSLKSGTAGWRSECQ